MVLWIVLKMCAPWVDWFRRFAHTFFPSHLFRTLDFISALIRRATTELKILEQRTEGIAAGKSLLALNFVITRCTMQIKSEFVKR